MADESSATGLDAVVQELRKISGLLQAIKTEMENIKYYPQHYTEQTYREIVKVVGELEKLNHENNS